MDKADLKPIDQRYDGLSNKAFLLAFMRDHGVTEEEIRHYNAWVYKGDVRNVFPNRKGMNFAIQQLSEMLNYRYMTLDDLRKDYSDAPWAWPTAMRFQPMCVPKNSIRADISRPYGTPILCNYLDKSYFFHVNKEEPYGPFLDELIEKGEWRIYTYSD